MAFEIGLTRPKDWSSMFLLWPHLHHASITHQPISLSNRTNELCLHLIYTRNTSRLVTRFVLLLLFCPPLVRSTFGPHPPAVLSDCPLCPVLHNGTHKFVALIISFPSNVIITDWRRFLELASGRTRPERTRGELVHDGHGVLVLRPSLIAVRPHV